MARMEKNRNTYRILAERLNDIVILENRDAVQREVNVKTVLQSMGQNRTGWIRYFQKNEQ